LNNAEVLGLSGNDMFNLEMSGGFSWDFCDKEGQNPGF